jgi:hypothetical protein
MVRTSRLVARLLALQTRTNWKQVYTDVLPHVSNYKDGSISKHEKA